MAAVLEADLFECHHGAGGCNLQTTAATVGDVGIDAERSEAFGTVDLAVGSFADLLETAVVGDGARGERPTMDGVVADGRLEGGVVGDITGMGEPVVQRDGIFAGCQWLGGGRRRCWRCCRHIGSR